jgi:hypothetical protein
MNRRFHVVLTCAILLSGMLAAPAAGTFHLMQIEQVIGGVNGDPTAQAIQLRMRAAFENMLAPARLVVVDATGSNPIVVHDFTVGVPNHGSGVRILIASANFSAHYTTPGATADYVITNLIPASYLAAGSLTFQEDTGTVLWRLSWGGTNYTGPTTGAITNDPDGEFGPPWPGPLPSDGLSALRYTRGAMTASNNNAADYEVTSGAAVFVNNAAASYTVSTPACATCRGDTLGFDRVDGRAIQQFLKCVEANTPGVVGCVCADMDGNVVFNQDDMDAFLDRLLGISDPNPACP